MKRRKFTFRHFFTNNKITVYIDSYLSVVYDCEKTQLRKNDDKTIWVRKCIRGT